MARSVVEVQCGTCGAVFMAVFFSVAVYPQRTGDVRLAGYGSTRFAGRVEMFARGKWMGVCNDRFSRLDGHVVCRQLGLGHAAKLVNVDKDHLYKIYLRRRLDNVYNR